MDNASNNDTMMWELSSLLNECEIDVDAVDRRVMCYGHVVDLTSGCVIKNSEDREGNHDDREPIALGRDVVRTIRASNARRESFDTVIENGNRKHLFMKGEPPRPVIVKKLELLRSVSTRWDSVYQMLRRLRELQPVSITFIF